MLGIFGWFFGDFFIDDYPTTLEYTGIFRFLNNPEILSGATFFGLALITASKSVLALAIISNLVYWWFLRTVEKYVTILMLWLPMLTVYATARTCKKSTATLLERKLA